jgi:hypothetical protein
MQGGDDLSTTAESSRCGRAGLRGPAVVALATLCAAVVPTNAQEAEKTVEAAPPPHRVAAPRERPLPPVRGEDGLWRWLRDQARRVRTLDGGPVAFAVRYRISPQLARTIQDAAEAEGLDPDLGFRLVRA